jgi:gamma-glutamyltranspeptidase/glutathione hydrolase
MHSLRRFAPLALVCALASSLIAREPVRTRKAMVVAQEPVAADIGVKVLRSGGNAIDAAVAVAFALAVTHPSAGNIGGGGFILARFAGGRTTFIDFRERAPQAASRDMYLDDAGKLTEQSRIGWRAAGVPGTVRGLEYAHRKYGRANWLDLVQPAAELASFGVALSYAESRSICSARKLLERFPESRRIFLNGGGCYQPDEVLIQPELGKVLSRIATEGAKDFYEGETARILAEEMKANGGEITMEDLKAYQVVEREPLKGSYKGYDIITAPPPSSGGVGMLQMMAMLEGTGYEKAGAGSAASTHYFAEVMRRCYADRAKYLGDPDFVKVPVRGLISKAYNARLRSNIDPAKATPSHTLPAGDAPAYESAETTHLNVVDAEGNAVALTYTINGSYGNGVAVPRLGFLLNNEMDDFAAKPGEPNMFGLVQGEANAIAPRKRPLSSMTPTIVLKDGKLFMVLGAPGGSRIITGVTQVLLNVLDFGMTVQQAVDQPRFHHQWKPDKLYLERGFSPDTKALLMQRGHQLEEITSVASVEAILLGGGWLQGALNGRSAGKAAGY